MTFLISAQATYETSLNRDKEMKKPKYTREKCTNAKKEWRMSILQMIYSGHNEWRELMWMWKLK